MIPDEKVERQAKRLCDMDYEDENSWEEHLIEEQYGGYRRMARFVLERQERLLEKIEEQITLVESCEQTSFRAGQLSVMNWSRRNINWMFDDEQDEKEGR